MPYGRKPKLVRLDLICLGANPEKLFREDIPAADVPALTEPQQIELYRLNYKRRVSTLSPGEEATLHRLMMIARGRK